ncbi:MAG: O-antigen ligase family protein [Clostridiaceae bacterium]|nr:O-antigen ligase family protein [Clostridiaceae bacterium]
MKKQLQRKYDGNIKSKAMIRQHSLRQVRQDLKQMKRISELIDYIPERGIEWSAAGLLLIWSMTPLIVLLRLSWYNILLQIGFLGLLLGLAGGAKRIRYYTQHKDEWKHYLLNHLLPLFLLLLLFWSILSFLASDNHELSFYGDLYRSDGLLSYFAYAGIFTCGCLVKHIRPLKMILALFSVAAAILSLLILIDSQPVNRLLLLHKDAAVFYNTNHFGYYACLAIMCSLLLWMTESKSLFRQIFWLTTLGILTAALVKNASLGPYLAVLVGLTISFVLILWLKRTQARRFLVAAAIFFLASGITDAQSGKLLHDFLQLFTDTSSIANGSENADQAGSGRWRLWLAGLRFTAEKPLFGYGPDNLGKRYLDLGIQIDRPHNELIQIAASLGVPALLFYLSALTAHLAAFFRKRKQLTMVVIGLCGALLTYFVSSLFGNTMYYTTPFFLMVLGLSNGMLQPASDALGE